MEERMGKQIGKGNKINRHKKIKTELGSEQQYRRLLPHRTSCKE